MFGSFVMAFVTLFVTANFASASVTGWTDVTVRVYDVTALDGKMRRAALELARSALASASVEITWRVCNGENAHTSHCDVRLAPGELAIRIVRMPMVSEQGGALRLGDAFIDSQVGRGVLATIYLDRVLRLAEQTGADRIALLGRAIAHELGHLLMATNAHGPVGLMRGFWSQDEVRRGKPSDWTFAPRDAEAIRRGAQSNHALAGGGDAGTPPRDTGLGVRDSGLTAPGSEFSAR